MRCEIISREKIINALLIGNTIFVWLVLKEFVKIKLLGKNKDE